MWECLQLSVWCFVSEVLLFQLKKQEIYWEVNWPDNTELFMGENYWNLNPEWSNWKLNDDRLCRQHGVVQVWPRLCCCCDGELETWIMVRRLRETIYGEEWQHHQWYMKYRSTNEQLLGLPQWFISTQAFIQPSSLQASAEIIITRLLSSVLTIIWLLISPG